MVEPLRLFSEGFALGISTGFACLATCGPIYSAYLMQQNRTPWRYVTAVLEMSLGRFVTYLLIGAIAGLIGTQVSELQRDYFTVAAYLLFSTFLMISVFRNSKCESGCKVSKWNRFAEWPFLLGLVTGINVCPSFLLAFSRSFVLSGPVSGMMFFAAFFVGTNLFLLPLSFVGMFGRKKLFRSIARVAAILVAIWFTGSAVHTGYGLVSPYFDKRPVINLLDETSAYVLLDDKVRSQFCAERLALQRTGKVIIADTVAHYGGERYYIFTDSAHVVKDTAAFRRPNCFVAVVTDRYLAAPESLDVAINFLKQYHFRFNKKKGDVFYIR
jgi:sulfite exporter TauE/SafE